MLPKKRSFVYKLQNIRRFVNAQILYKFDQFNRSRQRSAGDYELVFQILKFWLIHGSDPCRYSLSQLPNFTMPVAGIAVSCGRIGHKIQSLYNNINVDNSAGFRYWEKYCCRSFDISIYWDATEADTQFAIFS